MGRRALVGPATEYIAGQLAEARKRKGWSLDQAAGHARVARSTIDRAESGQVAIAVEALMFIAPALDLDAADLVREAAAFAALRNVSSDRLGSSVRERR